MAKKSKDPLEQVLRNIESLIQNRIDTVISDVETSLQNDPMLVQQILEVQSDTGPDWSSSMQQTFEYYAVDPFSWMDLEKLDNVESCTITRDADNETKGSATITSETDLSDTYVRCYLVAVQSGYTFKIPIGTHMYQAPGFSYNGKRQIVNQDGYTSLIELKESMPPIGFALSKKSTIMSNAYNIAMEHMRAPITPASSTSKLAQNFVSDENDTWLSFLSDLISNASFEFGVDALGQIFFDTIKDTSAMNPVYVYTDDNSSILYPEIQMQRDLYGVPNVVEVVYSSTNGTPIFSRAVNSDKDSIISVLARGREVVYRETNPDIAEGATQSDVDEYAKILLKNLSSFEFQITYTHGYCPVELGDCVELNYEKAGISHVKARVIRQVIKCEPGCPVEETAVYTQEL